MQANVQFYLTSYNVCVLGVEILLCLEVFTAASSGLEISKRGLRYTQLSVIACTYVSKSKAISALRLLS